MYVCMLILGFFDYLHFHVNSVSKACLRASRTTFRFSGSMEKCTHNCLNIKLSKNIFPVYRAKPHVQVS